MRQTKPKILLILVLLSLGLQAFSASKVAMPLPEVALHEQVMDDHSHEDHSHDVVEEDDSHDFSTHRHSHNPADHSHDMSGLVMPRIVTIATVILPHPVFSHAFAWVAHTITGPERPPKA